MKPTITIEYCPKCNWLLRSAYLAQELLTTFEADLHGITLCPSETAGKFTVYMANLVLFDRKAQGRFPEIKELKQIVRNAVNPEKTWDIQTALQNSIANRYFLRVYNSLVIFVSNN